MSNVTELRPERVLVELGGRERELKFDLNAYAELEKKFGSVEIAMKTLEKGNMASIKTIVWAALIHEEANLDEDGELIGYKITPFKVGSWIDTGNLPEVSAKLSSALGGSLPAKEALKQAIDVSGTDVSFLTESKIAVITYTAEEKAEMEKNA